MTDKQITIDGVDVSGCEYYGPIQNDCVVDNCLCSENPNCYYKQLKGKEQECEELVSKGNQLDKKCKQQSWDIGNLGYKIKNQRHEINNRLKQLDQFKSENEKLKKNVERWKSNFNGKVSAIEELIQIIQQALKDFSIEVGTPQYDRLLNGAKSLGIEVKDYE